MGFNHLLAVGLSSFVFFLRRSLLLIWSPYKTMRAIRNDSDILQVIFIFLAIVLYFFTANHLKEYDYPPIFLFLLTLIHYLLTVLYFGFFSFLSNDTNKRGIRPFLLLFAYALVPTLIWFAVNSVLYGLIPPPRTPSFLGKGFSVLYISFSVAVLMWKVIVTYLAIRFSTGFRFFRISYSLILYLAVVIPYAVFLYSQRIFRIPFL
ncbi:hypothetical protein KBD81_04920 [Candidatus Woesebacteria bacterium]|nr:hypothetical protein [Candidatus Woesebacteria bacterium]